MGWGRCILFLRSCSTIPSGQPATCFANQRGRRRNHSSPVQSVHSTTLSSLTTSPSSSSQSPPCNRRRGGWSPDTLCRREHSNGSSSPPTNLLANSRSRRCNRIGPLGWLLGSPCPCAGSSIASCRCSNRPANSPSQRCSRTGSMWWCHSPSLHASSTKPSCQATRCSPIWRSLPRNRRAGWS